MISSGFLSWGDICNSITQFTIYDRWGEIVHDFQGGTGLGISPYLGKAGIIRPISIFLSVPPSTSFASVRWRESGSLR